MKKVLIAVSVIFSLVFLGIGCTATNGKTKEFNKHVAEIDKQINEINKLQNQSQKYLNSLSKLTAKKSTLKKSVENVDKVIDLTDKSTDHLNYAIAEAREGRKLNASAESAKYAQMLEESFKTRLQSYRLMNKGLDSFKDTINKVIANQIKDIKKFQSEANQSIEMLNRAAKNEQKATRLYSEAQDYYSKNLKK